jgi:Rad3-related DNA helicase
VVIVNHHLLFADAAVRQNAFGEVIPAFTRAILDEAHQLEDVATQYFGYSVSTYRVEELARDVERLVAAGGVEGRKAKGEMAKAVERLRDLARAFFNELALAPGRRTRPGEGGPRHRRVAGRVYDAAAHPPAPWISSKPTSLSCENRCRRERKHRPP